jgi:DNA mismatch repair protein MutL
VNGRLIRDKLLIHAISSAFYNLMPAGCYPFALLFLACDPSEVDVNVHPSKTEVRFRHGSFVHDMVRDTIRTVLMEQRPASRIPLHFESPQPIPSARPASEGRAFTGQQAAVLPFSEFSRMMESEPIQLPSELSLTQPGGETLPEMTVYSTGTAPIPASKIDGSNEQLTAELMPERSLSRRVPDTHGDLGHLASDWERADSLAQLPDLRPLGQLHESFIIAAGRDGLWIIDQHVAHERILFERVLRERASGRVELQRLLMPIVLNLSVSQQFEYARIADELNATGFETEPFGHRTIAVKAAPAGLNAGHIEQVLFEILEIAESELRSASFDEVRRNIAATIACRAAIKVNMKLEPAKIEWMLKTLAQCEFPMTCPHGRPIALRYKTRDILRSFHRI